MRQTTRQARGIQWSLTQKLEDLDFADDICLLAHTHRDIQAKTEDLQKNAGQTGLKVNIGKTKTMRINARNETPIKINGEALDEVPTFTYLGSIVSKTGGTDEDIAARISKARHAFVTLKPVWNNKLISTQTKLRIFTSNVKSVLLYGAETWKQTKGTQTKLQVFTNKCLRQILKIHWPEKITNKELWQRSRQKSVEVDIKERKWKWMGHTWRKGPTNLTYQALEWNPQ